MGDLPTLPAEAMEIVARDEIARSRATRKLRDVLRRACSGKGTTPSIRTISVLGSYARGATSVGDIDITIDLDDPRDERQAALDDYYAFVRGRNPHADLFRELRCSGASMVNAVVVQRFGDHPEPVPPERWRDDLGPEYELAEPPPMGHVATQQPLAGPAHLLYVRGDSFEDALGRLAAIKEDPSASRFERTTGVPLLDPLADLVGVNTQYKLAKLVLAGGLDLKAVVLEETDEIPEPVFDLELRLNVIPGGKARRPAVIAAITYLLEDGVDPELIWLRHTSLVDDEIEPFVLLDWGAMTFYGAGERLRHGWDRLFLVLGSHRKGPWIALDCTARDPKILEEVEGREHAAIARRMNAAVEGELREVRERR